MKAFFIPTKQECYLRADMSSEKIDGSKITTLAEVRKFGFPVYGVKDGCKRASKITETKRLPMTGKTIQATLGEDEAKPVAVRGYWLSSPTGWLFVYETSTQNSLPVMNFFECALFLPPDNLLHDMTEYRAVLNPYFAIGLVLPRYRRRKGKIEILTSDEKIVKILNSHMVLRANLREPGTYELANKWRTDIFSFDKRGRAACVIPSWVYILGDHNLSAFLGGILYKRRLYGDRYTSFSHNMRINLCKFFNTLGLVSAVFNGDLIVYNNYHLQPEKWNTKKDNLNYPSHIPWYSQFTKKKPAEEKCDVIFADLDSLSINGILQEGVDYGIV